MSGRGTKQPEVCARVSFLLQAPSALALGARFQGKSSSEYPPPWASTARFLSLQVRKVASRCVLRLHPAAKHSFCSCCGTANHLVGPDSGGGTAETLSLNPRVRLRSRRVGVRSPPPRLVVRCSTCARVTRHPVGMERASWRSSVHQAYADDCRGRRLDGFWKVRESLAQSGGSEPAAEVRNIPAELGVPVEEGPGPGVSTQFSGSEWQRKARVARRTRKRKLLRERKRRRRAGLK